MKLTRKYVTYLWAAVVLCMGFYPPWTGQPYSRSDGNSWWEQIDTGRTNHYDFLFAGFTSGRLDVYRLFLQWFMVTAGAGTLYFLLGRVQLPIPGLHRPRHQWLMIAASLFIVFTGTAEYWYLSKLKADLTPALPKGFTLESDTPHAPPDWSLARQELTVLVLTLGMAVFAGSYAIKSRKKRPREMTVMRKEALPPAGSQNPVYTGRLEQPR